MRVQGGVEAMMVVSALLFILLAMTTYAYFIGQQLDPMQKEADYFDECSKLQTLLVASSLSDREIITYFLYNITLKAGSLTAYSTDPGTDMICPILIPANGTIIVPPSWYYPVNGTKFMSKDGLVNVTAGWYT
jgi:hypothetical protein